MSDREPILTLTKKDFKVRYFSGSGPGGQHRNKSQNCCQITHIESGISQQCTAHRSREQNKREAFENLVNKPEFKLWLAKKNGTYVEPERNTEVIRNYNYGRNEVKDHRTGKKYKLDKIMKGELNQIRKDLDSR